METLFKFMYRIHLSWRVYMNLSTHALHSRKEQLILFPGMAMTFKYISH